jgi:hypothetical protein
MMASDKEKQGHNGAKEHEHDQKGSESRSSSRSQASSGGKEKETHSRANANAKESENKEHKSSQRKSGQDEKAQEKSKSNRQSKGGEARLEAGKSGRTTDHDTIRRWVEERGGHPATVAATEGKNDPGLLRIDFPGRGGENRLEEISWEDFFDKFEEKKLAFLYQEETRTGRQSRFSKFVARGNEEKK